MAKKSAGKVVKKSMTAADHRKMAATHRAKGSLHNAKADLLEAQNPPKKNTRMGPY